MPQADQVLTVSFDTRPTGIFADAAGSAAAVMDAVHCRLDQLVALIYLVRGNEDLPTVAREALAAIEVSLEDTAALLTVVRA